MRRRAVFIVLIDMAVIDQAAEPGSLIIHKLVAADLVTEPDGPTRLNVADDARATADPGVLRRFEASARIDADMYRAALAVRDADRRQFTDWFAGADFLLTPATARTAPALVDVDEGDFTLAQYTRMANYLDLCAIALPCGFDRSGLPIGLQLIGRAGNETSLIAAAWAIE